MPDLMTTGQFAARSDLTLKALRLDGPAGAAGGCLSGPPFAVFHGTVGADSNGPVEVCLPTGGPIEPAGRIGVRLEPSHRAAYVEVGKERSRHPAILPAYDTLRFTSWSSRPGPPLVGSAVAGVELEPGAVGGALADGVQAQP
ncbi:hypothetical protein [Nonomuraea sp. NPDC049684]|uniref:hypothetical protein n=1 Tax=unclassified Nonomuraea TaxID=2593643 RepID=UPI00378B7111